MTSNQCILTLFNVSSNYTKKQIVNMFYCEENERCMWVVSCSLVCFTIRRINLPELMAARG